MSYITSPFSDADYYSTDWTSDTIDLTTFNPNGYTDMEFSLYWEEDRITNGSYIEVRIDIIDSAGTVIIPDIKRYDNGDLSTFTLPGYTEVKIKIKTYQHKSFNTDIKIENLTFDNKIWFVVNEGDRLLLDVMGYDQPNYETVNKLILGDEQSFWSKNFTATDFEPKLIGTESPIYDNPDVVWEDLYPNIGSTANTTSVYNDNKVYVFTDGSNFKLLDLGSMSWSALSNVTGTVLSGEYFNGKIYYLAYDGTDNKLWSYDISADAHTLLKTITTDIRTDCDSAIYLRKIYFFGGEQGIDLLVYDIDSNTTSTITGGYTTGDVTGMRGVISGSKIYMMGGNNTSSVYIYDAKFDEWSRGTDMLTAKNFFGCVATKNRYVESPDIIYTFNGSNTDHTSMDVVEAYDTSSDSWTVKHDSPFNNNKASTVSDGFYCWIVGGLLDKVWRYEPEPVSCVVGGYAYGQQNYGTGVYSDLQDRIRVGTCRVGSTENSELYTTYHDIYNYNVDSDGKVKFTTYLENPGSQETVIDSIGIFNSDATKKLFAYVKTKFPFGTVDTYKITGVFKITPVSTTKSVSMKEPVHGFLDRVFNGPYVSDYTYISKFLAGENTGYFTDTDTQMDIEHYGPVDFKTVTIDTGANSFQGTGNMDTTQGNGSDYNAFAMVCEEPGAKTLVNTAGFADGYDPFDNTGTATLAYDSGAAHSGVLGVTYSLPVDINSLSITLNGDQHTSGTLHLATYDGSAWNNEIELVICDGAFVVDDKYYLDKNVYGVGIVLDSFVGSVNLVDVYHAGNKRMMAFGTVINNTISKTSDYNILVDMKEDLK